MHTVDENVTLGGYSFGPCALRRDARDPDTEGVWTAVTGVIYIYVTQIYKVLWGDIHMYMCMHM